MVVSSPSGTPSTTRRGSPPWSCTTRRPWQTNSSGRRRSPPCSASWTVTSTTIRRWPVTSPPSQPAWTCSTTTAPPPSCARSCPPISSTTGAGRRSSHPPASRCGCMRPHPGRGRSVRCPGRPAGCHHTGTRPRRQAGLHLRTAMGPPPARGHARGRVVDFRGHGAPRAHRTAGAVQRGGPRFPPRSGCAGKPAEPVGLPPDDRVETAARRPPCACRPRAVHGARVDGAHGAADDVRRHGAGGLGAAGAGN